LVILNEVKDLSVIVPRPLSLRRASPPRSRPRTSLLVVDFSLAMYCPLCGAEYRPEFAVCSDCQVALVPDPPRSPSPNPPTDDTSGDTSFALVWSGSDPRKHAEVSEALDRQRIPARTLRREDHLFNPTIHPEFEVYVPVGLMSSAREALQQANLAEDDSEELTESGTLEIPAEEGAPDYPNDTNDERGDPLNFDPQDATVEIWSGQDFDMAAMVASSLRENHIPYRSDSDITEPNSASGETPAARLLVFPEDEKRAKEIVRQIVDAVPPR
jgi:hypothetical protein